MSKEQHQGIIVSKKRYNDSILLGIITTESFYITGWVKDEFVAHNQSQVYCFELIFFRKHGNSLFIQDSGKSIVHDFWHDPVYLNNLEALLKITKPLPANIYHENLYDTFVSAIKMLANNPEEALQNWDKFISEI
jgi:hypothetical protein